MSSSSHSAEAAAEKAAFLGKAPIWRIILKVAPPVMFSETVACLYNICDSGFIGHYSADALTGLTIIMPIQFMAYSLAVGTGLGVDTLMAKLYAEKRPQKAFDVAGVGTLMAVVEWLLYSLVILLVLPKFAAWSANSPGSIRATLTYGFIVCLGSLPMFMEGIWSKAHQAGGNMTRPMLAQVAGALTNIALDGPMIFGWGPVPSMGEAGAAWATVIGQAVAAAIVFKGGFHRLPKLKDISHLVWAIWSFAYSQIIRFSTMTLYIVLLNITLARFCDAAVTVLGLYYKMQSFIFIPMSALGTCIVPILSYNATQHQYQRCQEVLKVTVFYSMLFVTIGFLLFELTPHWVLSIFTNDAQTHEIGAPAFRIIGLSLFSAVLSLLAPIVFQAVGKGGISVFMSLLRQIFTLLPIFVLLSLVGLNYCWLAFPISETITALAGLKYYGKLLKEWKYATPSRQA